MRICEGYWVWSRRFCFCLATGRPCHGMMKEHVHRLTSMFRFGQSQRVAGSMNRLLRYVISEGLTSVLGVFEKLRKATVTSVVCVCVCVCVCICVFVCARLSVRTEQFCSHRTEFHEI